MDEVPDPVFSERMTGDGIAISAESFEVLAPCNGRISLFFDTKHAFALTTEEGIQVLVHFGLDTVILNGEGIEALKAPGESVAAGEPVIRISEKLLKKHGINLISPVLIVNPERVCDMSLPSHGGLMEAGKDAAIEYSLR